MLSMDDEERKWLALQLRHPPVQRSKEDRGSALWSQIQFCCHRSTDVDAHCPPGYLGLRHPIIAKVMLDPAHLREFKHKAFDSRKSFECVQSKPRMPFFFRGSIQHLNSSYRITTNREFESRKVFLQVWIFDFWKDLGYHNRRVWDNNVDLELIEWRSWLHHTLVHYCTSTVIYSSSVLICQERLWKAPFDSFTLTPTHFCAFFFSVAYDFHPLVGVFIATRLAFTYMYWMVYLFLHFFCSSMTN